MREIIKQAATVDEAIELALKELNLSREMVTAEVLDYPEKRLFFKKPAKVKVSELEESFNVKDMFNESDMLQKAEAKKQEKPQQTAPQHKPVVKQGVAEKTSQDIKGDGEETIIPIDQASGKVKYAMDFLHSIVDGFFTGEYQLQPVKTQAGYIIKITGENAGALIGRKGETMEAISYLTSLAANRNEDSDEKVSVDIGGYRKKRENDLSEIAKKTAIRVAKTGRSFIFDPMSPYERRIIHAAVGEIEGVKSESKGEGSQRRVALYSTTQRAPRPESDRPYSKPYNKSATGARPQSGTRPPYNRDKRDKPQPVVQKTRDEKMVDNANAPLYSKIDL